MYHQRLLYSFLFLIFLLPISYSIDPRYQTCAPSQCRGIKISYPFRMVTQPVYCGYPGFVLSCRDDKLILQLKADNFTILQIDYEKNITILVNEQLEATDCPVPLHNFTLDSLPFRMIPGTPTLSFYDCSQKIWNPIFFPITCLSNNSRFVYFTNLDEARGIVNLDNCAPPVVIPILETAFRALPSLNFSVAVKALRQGFRLAWAMGQCRECESSRGRCGYNTSIPQPGLVCFCRDGGDGLTCSAGKKNVGLKIIIGISASAGTLLLTGAAFFVYYRRRKMKQTSPSSLFLTRSMSSDPPIKPDHEKGSTTQFLTNMPTLSLFTYKELEQATNSFNPSNELGDGGFGTVYYGKLRDGRSVAVKRLYENNYKRVEQFMNEVKILSGLRHQNLVCLYGCTSRHSRELLLVYEYIPNGTVADHLHGDLAKVKGGLNWSTRLKIALETAEALAFLHAVEPPIIHRDVKTNNILLDNSYQVKVADFGLSRLFPLDATHVSTAPQGTPGYVDPDYHQCYQLTDKSDVYSFGVVLVELISSKPAVDITRHRHEINLANLAINKIINRALSELVDQSLGFESDFRVRRMMTGVAELAFRCLSAEKEERPTMEEVLEILRGIEKDGIEGKTPKEQPEILADDVVLLKSQVPFSPDSVTEKWASRSTTPNTSNEG